MAVEAEFRILCPAHQGPVSWRAVQGCPDCQQGFADAAARARLDAACRALARGGTT